METKDEKFEETLALFDKRNPEYTEEKAHMAHMDYLIMVDGRIIWREPEKDYK